MDNKEKDINYNRYEDKILSLGNIRMKLEKKTAEILDKDTVELLILRYKSSNEIDEKTNEPKTKEIILGELKNLNKDSQIAYINWLRTLGTEDIRVINESVETLSKRKDVVSAKFDIWTRLQGIGNKLSEFINLTEEGHKLLGTKLDKETVCKPTFKYSSTVKRTKNLDDLELFGNTETKNVYSNYFKDSSEWKKLDDQQLENENDQKEKFVNDLKSCVNDGKANSTVVFKYYNDSKELQENKER